MSDTATAEDGAPDGDQHFMSPVEIRARRLALGLTRHGASELWGIKQDTWMKWEDGRRRCPPAIADLFTAAETVVEDWTADAIAAARELIDGGATTITLDVHIDGIEHTTAGGSTTILPGAFHAVAMARARAALTRAYPRTRVHLAQQPSAQGE